MIPRSLIWLPTSGTWALAYNWNDTTNGFDPAQSAPTSIDSVTVANTGGTAVIAGPGVAGSAAFSGSVELLGGFAFGTLTLGTDLVPGTGFTPGQLLLGGGASVTDTVSLLDAGSVAVDGAGTVFAAGALTLGTGLAGVGFAAETLAATNGATVTASAVVLDAQAASLSVDYASFFEIGGTGNRVAGAVVIDAGASLSGWGTVAAFGTIVNDGGIVASGGGLLLGSVQGTGTITIDPGAVLTFDGAAGAGQSIGFAGSGTLALTTERVSPLGVITGFGAGDAIDEIGSPITGAAYTPGAGGVGTLTLTYGGQVAAVFLLAGNYAGDVFLTASDGAQGTAITVAAAGGGGGGGPGPGTPGPDRYDWIAATGGGYGTAANWQDTTAHQNPAAVSPGSHDLVTIAGPAGGGFAVVTGPGNAATLTILAGVALSGAFAAGVLDVGQTTAGATPGTLDLIAGTLTAASGAIADGAITAAGAGTTLAVAGTLVLGGGPGGVGLPTTALAADNGASVVAGGLVMGGGSGDTLTTDTTGRIVIGNAGALTGAVAGAVTISAGATLSGNGRVNPYGLVVDAGLVVASGGTLTLGTLEGPGAATVAAGATLELLARTPIGVGFAGAAGTLALASELALPTGVIAGFAQGDTVRIEADTITNLSWASAGGVGTLTLYYGAQVAGTLLFAGDFSGETFAVTPDGLGTDIVLLAGGGGGGTGGNGDGTDALTWNLPVSGSWNQAANWRDTTTGTPAASAPGAQDPVTLLGPSGLFQTVSGTGTCASLAVLGDTALAGQFTTGALAVGTVAVGAGATMGELLLAGGATLATSGGTVADGSVLVQGSARFTASGTLTLGGGLPGVGLPATLVAATGGGFVQLGGLGLGGGSGDLVTADAFSTVVIGGGGGVAGAVTIAAGVTVAGNGGIDPSGRVVDDGTITASGGTLVLGQTSGTGTLAIADGACLQLAATDSVGVGFAGSAGVLNLPGGVALPTGVIAGFVAGDRIVLAGTGTGAVSYQPGGGGIGTLTILYGGVPAGQLLIAGDYSRDLFLAQPSSGGMVVTVVPQGVGPSPGTTTPDQYVWTGAAGLGWNDAANWNDLSANQSPAAVAPGALDLVTIQGGTAAYQAVTGPANAATLAILGQVALYGRYQVGSLQVGQGAAGTLGLGTAGTLALGAGETLTAGTALVADGLLSVTGAAAFFQDAGTLVLGLGAAAGTLTAGLGARVQLAGLALGRGGVTIDATASVEIGALGGALAGALTIDAGQAVAGAGTIVAANGIVDNGTITATGAGTLTLGPVTGAGTLGIGAGATLQLQAADSVGVGFAGTGTLLLPGALPTGAIAGFAPGDAIVLARAGGTVAYQAGGNGIGTLTLSFGGVVTGRLLLAGNYAGDLFFTTAGAQGTAIALTPQNAGPPSPGTTTPDQYVWTGLAGVGWNTAGNWNDLTAGQTPALLAPGLHDLVTIQGGGTLQPVTGPGNAASLTIERGVALYGQYSVGTLQVGAAGNAGTLALGAGVVMDAGSALVAAGALEIGAGAAFAASGTLTLGQGSGAGALSVTAGGRVQLGGLVLAGAASTLGLDAASSIEIGNLGAAAGALTIDPGFTVSGTGTLTPAAIVDNGTIAATSGTLTLGALTGTGTLSVNAATLVLGGTVTGRLAAVFGTAGTLSTSATALAALTLENFAAGDALALNLAQANGAVYVANGLGTGTLELLSGNVVVASVAVTGITPSAVFSVTSSHGQAVVTEIAPSTSTDTLTWDFPGSGYWNQASNWLDTTTSGVAALPPGARDPVIIANTGLPETITGIGACASLAITGTTTLAGQFTTGAFTLGGAQTPGEMRLGGGDTLSLADGAVLSGGVLVDGAGAQLIASGTLALGGLGYACLVSATAGGRVQLGGLTLAGGSLEQVIADAGSSVEIGGVGGALGAVTVDTGFAVQGNGALNPAGQVVDNGTILALGGTLTLGATTGSGTLSIGGGAALQLNQGDSVAVGFAGAAGTLILPGNGALPTATITGFAPGDQIELLGSQSATVSYQGGGAIGTLTLTEGGVPAGQLLLAGDYSGDLFLIQTASDGLGMVITVTPQNAGPPSPGTTTPDQYVWTGRSGVGWNTAGNWADLSAGQSPAAIAPGAADLVTLQGPVATGTLVVTGPGNAASLAVDGQVRLYGQYALGTLQVGAGGNTGTLTLGAGDAVSAGAVLVAGGLDLAGAALHASGTLTLGQGSAAGRLVASAAASVQLGGLVLADAASSFSLDATCAIEIGAIGGALLGGLTIDPGHTLSGAGSVAAPAGIVDNGTIAASGGTLALGALSGVGTLSVAAATLDLNGSVAGSLTAVFSGAGTLSVAAADLPALTLKNFTAGDGLILSLPQVNGALYVATGAGVGKLEFLAGNSVVASVAIEGENPTALFSVKGGAGSVMVTQTGANDTGSGQQSSGLFIASQPVYLQNDLAAAIGGLNSCWVDYSADGVTWTPVSLPYAYMGVATTPTPYSMVVLGAGYKSLLVQGVAPVLLFDNSQNNAVLSPNLGQDTVIAYGNNNTIAGAPGGSMLVFSHQTATIQGGGFDTISTGNGNDTTTTSRFSSQVYLGPAHNAVYSNGVDSIQGQQGTGLSYDTIFAAGPQTTAWAPVMGILDFIGGPGAATVYGGASTELVTGGTGQLLLFGGTQGVQLAGGAGSSTVYGGAAQTYVVGGAGPITAFGGGGVGQFVGAPGNSVFIMGEGLATVNAAAGNTVWLSGRSPDVVTANGDNIHVNAPGSLANNLLLAGAGSETLIGGAGNDTVVGGSGHATLSGGAGYNDFIFNAGQTGGTDLITDFIPGHDLLILRGYATSSAQVLAGAVVSGGNTTLTLSDGTHITLAGITHLTAANFA